MEINLNVQLQQLVLGCKKREAASQKQLFKLYYGRMLGLCMRYCACRTDAEDVTQEGFIKLFDKIDLYNETGSFEGWMKRLFVNLALDHLRKNKVKLLSLDSEDNYYEPSNSVEEVEDELLTLVGAEKLISEIQNLTPVYRTVLNLYVYEGYSHNEIAEELGISVGTSKSNLFKAKKNLRKALAKYVEAKYAS